MYIYMCVSVYIDWSKLRKTIEMIFSVNFCQDNHCKLHLHKDHKCPPPPLLHPHQRIGLRSTSQQRKVEDTESPQRTSRHASPRHVALNTSDTISFVETLQSHFLEALYRSLWRPQIVVPGVDDVFLPQQNPHEVCFHKVTRSQEVLCFLRGFVLVPQVS